MIAKVITGKSFGGCVRYLLEREKSFVLDTAGVRDYNIKAIIADLNAQRKMRPQLGNAVGHTVLSWSNEDQNGYICTAVFIFQKAFDIALRGIIVLHRTVCKFAFLLFVVVFNQTAECPPRLC